jgi:glycine betaine/proline transport system substrate-binding protein
MKFLKNILIPITFVLSLAFGTSSANACKINLGDFDWSSANVHTAIVEFILVKGYDCDVTVTKGSTTPIMAALFDQQIDVVTEIWRDNIKQIVEEAVAKDQIIEAGINTPESVQAFYVDKATSDKYNLKSVDDMKSAEVAALFADPESPGMGRMTSCISGWTCYTVNLVKHKEYGLDEFYTNFDPGSSGALDAAIAGGFKKGTPIFTYYWEPTGLMGKVDLVRLEEPAYDQACWDNLQVVVEDIKANGPDAYKPSCACEYQDMALTKAVTTTFAAKHPEIVEFIKSYTLPTPLVNSMLAYYEDETQGDMEETARHFLSTENVWENWVPAEVIGKVKAAL